MSDELVEADEVDFALAAFHADGAWTVAELAHDLLTDVESLVAALRRFPGDGGAVALIGIDEDFFLIVRVTGTTARLLLSDITAADEWELAASAVEFLGLPLPDDEDEPEPAGALDLLADLGMSGPDMAILLEDDELYPDEMLSEVAGRLGFGQLFDDAIGFTSA